MVVGMPSIKIPEQACSTCLIGKQSRLAFNSSLPMRAIQVMNVVHSNYMGQWIYQPIVEIGIS
jgi:hypothetical protein